MKKINVAFFATVQTKGKHIIPSKNILVKLIYLYA